MSSLVYIHGKIAFCFTTGYTIVTWVFIIVAMLNTVRAENGNAIKFAPLPKPTEYNLHGANTRENGLVSISFGIANLLRNKPPYDIINNVLISNSESITAKQIADYEAPMIGLAAISLLFAIAIPIVGIVVCLCRFAGKCGGDLESIKDLDIRPTKKRKRFTLAIVLCCVFMISGSILIMVSSNEMSSSLPQTRKTVNDVFDDIFIYKSNTFQELNHILGSEVLQVLDVIIDKVVKLGLDIVRPILDKGGDKITKLISSINKLDTALTTSLKLLQEIDSNIQSLVIEAEEIQKTLSEAKNNITSAKKNCSLPSSCNDIPDGKVLSIDANFSVVSNITDTRTKVQDVVESNLTNEAAKGQANFNDLPSTIQNLASDFTTDFRNFSQNLQDVKIDVLKPWEEKIDKILNDTLLPNKDGIDRYLRPDSDLILYDNYRNITYIVTSFMVLVVVALALLGLILGMVGASTFDTPSTRGDLSDIGGRILIGSAAFAVFTALFINLVAAVVFFAGVNTAIVCRATSDYELLRNTIDSPDVMEVYSLSKLMFQDKNQRQNTLTFTSLLTDCSRSKAVWTALHLDESLYNLTSALDYKNKIPKIDTVFKEINKTVSNTSVMTTKAKQSVNDSFNAGVQNINFTEYYVQTNKPIVQVSLRKFADNITKAANNTPPDVKVQLEATANALINLDNTTVKSSKSKSDNVKSNVERLVNEADKIVDAVKDIAIELENIEEFLKTEGITIAHQGINKFAKVILEDIDQLVTHVIYQVRNDVGRCQPIYNIYQSLTTAVCHDYFGNLNTSWIGFGLCTLFTLITIILCTRAAKHFRRVHLSDNFKDSDKWDSKTEMPWDAGFEMKDQLIN